ncbi:MAG: alpha/beta hydrolase [Flavobacterium sp.]|nr:alpha/beta hydrolase [Flavobacterium sp.]
MKKLKYFLLTKSIGLYLNILSYVKPKKAAHLAYRLFSEPRDGRLSKDSIPDVLKDAELNTFSYQDYQFNTYTWPGNDNVIVLVHGWESNASRWERMLPYLKDSKSTIVAIDGPAHGLTSGLEFNVPVYAGFINVVVETFNPTILIGHSIGGAACMYYQHKYQSKSLQKMVILGAPSDLRVLLRNYIRLLNLNSRIIKLLDAYFLEKFSFAPDDFSATVFGPTLAVSGFIAHDIEDSIVAFEESQKIINHWKNVRFTETRGLGHSLHDDKLYRDIYQFLMD